MMAHETRTVIVIDHCAFPDAAQLKWPDHVFVGAFKTVSDMIALVSRRMPAMHDRQRPRRTGRGAGRDD